MTSCNNFRFIADLRFTSSLCKTDFFAMIHASFDVYGLSQEPHSEVGEVVKVMTKNVALVKVRNIQIALYH